MNYFSGKMSLRWSEACSDTVFAHSEFCNFLDVSLQRENFKTKRNSSALHYTEKK